MSLAKFCPYCGLQLPSGREFRFCPECGEELPRLLRQRLTVVLPDEENELLPAPLKLASTPPPILNDASPLQKGKKQSSDTKQEPHSPTLSPKNVGKSTYPQYAHTSYSPPSQDPISYPHTAEQEDATHQEEKNIPPSFLPEKAEAIQSKPPIPSFEQQPQNHVLLVEDDEAIREMYSLKLKKEGYQLDVATEGQEAATKIEHRTYDLILLDLMLPFINGLELLQRIKKLPQQKDTPVIILTNLDHEEMTRQCLALGAEKFLVKADISPQELIAECHEVLKKK